MSNTPSNSKREIIELLGPYAAEGHPFALLGLTPAPCSKAQIEAALQRQLDRVQQHPRSDSAAADRARVMLHEAAEELLDGRRQPQIIAAAQRGRAAETAPPRGPETVPRAAEPLPSRTRKERVGDPLVARAVVIGLGVVVLMIVVVVVGSLVRSSNTTPVSPINAASTPQAAPALTTDSPSPTPVESSAGASSEPSSAEAPRAAASTAGDWSPRARSQFVDPAQVVRELRAAVETVRSNPDKALAEFQRGFDLAADWWCRFEPAQARAASDAVAEFLYRVGSQREVAERAISVVESPASALSLPPSASIGADDVWPAAWSAGMLARLHRERDFPPGLATRIAASVDRALGEARPARSADSTFESGVASAFRTLPRVIISGRPRGLGAAVDGAASDAGAAIMRWVEGVSLAYKNDAAERERILTGALGWFLTGAAEPEADGRVFAAINQLAGEIKWREGGAARSAMIEWFNDPRVSSSDLRVLTAALASRSSAEGVTATMALPMSATAEDRAALRDTYAKAWGLAEASARAESARGWSAAATQAAALTAEPDDPAIQIACAAAYARLNAAAAAIWRGGTVGNGLSVAWSPPEGVEQAPDAAPSANRSTHRISVTLPNSGSSAATGNGQDGIWTQEYLSERNSIPGRLSRLDELSSRGRPIGPIDAGLLAQAALAEAPWKVREHAQIVLRVFAEEPALIGAMLDFLPMAPRTTDVSRLYADVAGLSLPAPADPGWEVEVRRAMLARLMGTLTSTGVHGQVEGSAAEIARAYMAAVDRKLSGESPGADEVAEAAQAAIIELADGLAARCRASPVSGSMKFNLDAIERRRAQRRIQAAGPVQSFAAEQAGLVELLAFAVASDRPARESEVSRVLDEAAARRRKSSHVFEQLLANERAILRLWIIRFKESDGQ